MFRKLTLTATTVTAAALLAFAPGAADAQTADAQQVQQQPVKGNVNGAEKMMGSSGSGATMDCQSIHASMKEMRLERQQMQATLDELAAKVKATHGARQQEAMAELLTTMVDQQRALNDMMSQRQKAMLTHVSNNPDATTRGRHESSGGMSGGTMMHGSMMNGSGGDDGNSATGGGAER